QEVFEGALLQLRGHAFGGEIEQAIAHERRNRLDEQQDEHQQTEDVDPVDATAADAFVDDQANYLRVGESGNDADADEDRTDRVGAPLRAQQLPQNPVHRFQLSAR